MDVKLVVVLSLLIESTCSAAIIQVGFSGELRSSSAELNPADTLRGYFEFDDASNHRGTSRGTEYNYGDLLQFSLWSSSGELSAHVGIVAELALPVPGASGGPRYQYTVAVGLPTYPSENQEDDSAIDSIDIPSDYGDVVTISLDYAVVYNPLLVLSLTGPASDLLSVDESLIPPTLDHVQDPTVTLYLREYGWSSGVTGHGAFGLIEMSAKYTLTSLEIIPEPGALGLTMGFLPFLLRKRRRIHCPSTRCS